MISHGEIVRVRRKDLPESQHWGWTVMRANADEWCAAMGDPGQFVIIEMHVCACCGGPWRIKWDREEYRCEKHSNRNPCAIEGCTRTTSAEDIAKRSDQWICGTHWRAYVPPRSVRRRAYHAFFRKARRHGWDDDLRRRFWRFWDQLVATARKRAAEGYINETEIKQLFGWD